MRDWLAILLVIGAASSVDAQRTIRVPADQPTIQAAIDSANNGDRVLVAPGRYVETIDFRGRDIEVRSERGPTVTTIDAQAAGPVVTFQQGETRAAILAGFTITGGLSPNGGGGVRCLGASPTIRGNRIVGNRVPTGGSPGGGGMLCIGGAPLIEGNAVERNAAPTSLSCDGAGVLIIGATAARLRDNRVAFNRGGTWASGVSVAGGAVRVEDCRIAHNEPWYGIYAQGAATQWFNSIIHDNAQIGLFVAQGSAIVGHCTITRNGAEAGLVAWGSAVQVVNSILWHNDGRLARVSSAFTTAATLVFEHCCVRGGRARVENLGGTLVWGAGMVESSPRFVAPEYGDFHLLADSPCVDAGAQRTGLPTRDRDGDLRGSRVDIGADEFAVHFYAGAQRVADPVARAGANTVLNVTGPAGAAVYWVAGSGLLPSPVPIPGIGDWSLVFPVTTPIPFGSLPPSGWRARRLGLPPSLAAGTRLPLQAIVVDGATATLTNAIEPTVQPPASRAIHRVPRDHATIQAAIDAAADGDTVHVAPGVYNEWIDFKGKAIHVRGTGGRQQTFLDNGGADRLVVFQQGEGTDSILEGFTLRGGRAQDGAGIACLGASPTIRGNRIVGCRATGSGGGIYSTGKPVVIDNIIEANTASTGGGFSGDGVLLKNDVRINGANNGGGIYLRRGIVDACRIERNAAAIAGGLFVSSGSIGGVRNTIIRANTADDGAGVVVGRVMTNCTIVGNHANRQIGGVQLVFSSGALHNCIVRGNTPSAGQVVATSAPVTGCNIEGGFPGANNIDVPSRFVDAAGGDLHLLHDSPDVDAGVIPAEDFAPTDVDGAPRLSGSAPDIGADEYAPAVYVVGDVRAGATMRVRVVGRPGARAIVALGAGRRFRPIEWPGLGFFDLADPIGVLFNGAIPARGYVTIAIPIPANTPPFTVGLQALVGVRLTPAVTASLR